MDNFVAKFISGDTTGLATIVGVTPVILVAAEHALKLMIARSFRFVWIANAVIGLVTAGRQFISYPLFQFLVRRHLLIRTFIIQ